MIFNMQSVNGCAEFESSHKALVKILKLLPSKDLQNVRLLNSSFNKLVTNHPELFWMKHTLHVNNGLLVRGTENQLWNCLQENTMIRLHKCPHFHFENMHLCITSAARFFNSVGHQVAYLKLTNCTVMYSTLLRILTHVGKTLKEFEIVGRRTVNDESFVDASGFIAIAPLELPFLEILVLYEAGTRISPLPTFPKVLLQAILFGTQRLKELIILGWNSETGRSLMHLLSSMDKCKRATIQCLQIHTLVDKTVAVNDQYGFINSIGSFDLPGLTSLRITFDKDLSDWSQVDEQQVGALTDNLVKFLNGASATLETIELINCPVLNEIIRSSTSTFQQLQHLNLHGSLVTYLDEEGNRLYQCSDGGDWCLEKSQRTRMPLTGMDQRLSEGLQRIGTFKVMCVVLTLAILVHLTLKTIFGPTLGHSLEVLVHSLILVIVFRGESIGALWEMAFLD